MKHSSLISALENGKSYSAALLYDLRESDIGKDEFSQITGKINSKYFQSSMVFSRLGNALINRKEYESVLECAELGLLIYPDNALLL